METKLLGDLVMEKIRPDPYLFQLLIYQITQLPISAGGLCVVGGLCGKT